MLSAPGAETPWGTVSQGRFTALLFPAAANQLSRAELSLDAAEARPQWEGGWAAVTNFHVELHFAALSSDTNQVQARLAAAAEQASSAWGSASNLQLSALWAQALTAPFAFSGRGELSGEGVESDAWEQAGPLRAGKALLLAHFARPATNTPAEDEAWAAWAKFEPYLFDWQCCSPASNRRSSSWTKSPWPETGTLRVCKSRISRLGLTRGARAPNSRLGLA